MENVSKALEMAASVLLAVIIMTLIVWFFSKISSVPREQNDVETAEQLAKFNLEYEVYDKKAMYGVDVISCLNKAQSNNEKYAEGGAFLEGEKYGKDYYIQVKVKLNSCLEESLRIYYYKDNKLVESFGDDAQEFTMGNAGFVFTEEYYTNFNSGTRLIPKTENLNASKFMKENTDYYLFDRSNPTGTTKLKKLMSYSGKYMKQTITNNTGANLDKWAQATWTTALYDFKIRKFKCDYIKYSSKTGRVNEIAFSEI